MFAMTADMRKAANVTHLFDETWVNVFEEFEKQEAEERDTDGMSGLTQNTGRTWFF